MREIFNRDIEFLFTDEFLFIIIALITMKITRYMMKIDDRYMKIYIGDFVHLLCCSMAINSQLILNNYEGNGRMILRQKRIIEMDDQI